MMGNENEGHSQTAFVVPMPEPSVNYTVKEVLERIERKQDTLNDRMFDRLDKLDERVTTIEHERDNRKLFRENWLALVALLAGLLAGAGTLILALQSIH
jgi:hypothetical protein